MLGRDEEALQSFRTSTDLWSQPQNQPQSVLPANRAKMFRGHAGAHEGLGQAYHRLGQDELAFQAYSAAISIDATDPNGYAGRGDVLASLKLLDAALTDFDEAIRLDPAHCAPTAGAGSSDLNSAVTNPPSPTSTAPLVLTPHTQRPIRIEVVCTHAGAKTSSR